MLLLRIRSVFTLASAVIVIAPALLAGNVLVVDASGGGAYTTIQAAIAAAADGDTILVKSGSYGPFTIDNKTISVVAEAGDVVDVTGTVRIENLGVERDALLVGLRIQVSTSDAPNSGLSASMNRGSVRVEDCRLGSLGYLEDGANVRDSSDVAFARCELSSGHSIYPGAALLAHGSLGSRVAIYDSYLQGGHSAGACWFVNCDAEPDGGSGAEVIGPSFLFGAGSTFFGGDGGRGSQGNGMDCSCGSDGGDGGDGVSVEFTGAAALLDNLYRAGLGATTCGCGYSGGPGQLVQGSTATLLDGRSRHLEIDNPQREQTSFQIRVNGRAGEEVYLFFSNRTAFRYVPGYRGVQLTQQPGPPILLGTIPSTGNLSFPFSIPDLGPGVQSRIDFFQAAHRTPQGVWTFGGPVSLVVLDQAF